MSARAFQRMTARAMKHFREPGVHRWFRHDGPAEGDVVTVMFASAYAETDTNGIRVSDEQPTLWIKLTDVLRIAPERGAAIDRAVDNDDTFVIGRFTYRAESCRSDGHGLLEVPLLKDRR